MLELLRIIKTKEVDPFTLATTGSTLETKTPIFEAPITPETRKFKLKKVKVRDQSQMTSFKLGIFRNPLSP